MYVCTLYACMYVCMYECMYACIYACMNVCMHACMYVNVYIYIQCKNVCMYIHVIIIYIYIRRYGWACLSQSACICLWDCASVEARPTSLKVGMGSPTTMVRFRPQLDLHPSKA